VPELEGARRHGARRGARKGALVHGERAGEVRRVPAALCQSLVGGAVERDQPDDALVRRGLGLQVAELVLRQRAVRPRQGVGRRQRRGPPQHRRRLRRVAAGAQHLPEVHEVAGVRRVRLERLLDQPRRFRKPPPLVRRQPRQVQRVGVPRRGLEHARVHRRRPGHIAGRVQGRALLERLVVPPRRPARCHRREAPGLPGHQDGEESEGVPRHRAAPVPLPPRAAPRRARLFARGAAADAVGEADHRRGAWRSRAARAACGTLVCAGGGVACDRVSAGRRRSPEPSRALS